MTASTMIPLASSALALFGWHSGQDILASWIDGAITQRPITSFCMMLAASMPWLLRSGDTVTKEVALSAVGFLMLLVMGVHASAALLGQMPPDRNPIPSVATMVAFLCIAVAGLIRAFRGNGWAEVNMAAAGMIGVVGLVGYLLRRPSLYYDWPGWSTAMAVPTALSFVLIGVAGAWPKLRRK